MSNETPFADAFESYWKAVEARFRTLEGRLAQVENAKRPLRERKR